MKLHLRCTVEIADHINEMHLHKKKILKKKKFIEINFFAFTAGILIHTAENSKKYVLQNGTLILNLRYTVDIADHFL